MSAAVQDLARLRAAGVAPVELPQALPPELLPVEEAFQIVRLAGKFAVPVPLPETMLANWLLTRSGSDHFDSPGRCFR